MITRVPHVLALSLMLSAASIAHADNGCENETFIVDVHELGACQVDNEPGIYGEVTNMTVVYVPVQNECVDEDAYLQSYMVCQRLDAWMLLVWQIPDPGNPDNPINKVALASRAYWEHMLD